MRLILLSLILFLSSSIINASISFNGSSYSVVSEKPEASTGLTSIYILHDFDGVKMTYTAASSSSSVSWSKFNNSGGRSVEPIYRSTLSL